MKIVIINGQNHKGSTWHIGNLLVQKIAGEKEIKEYEVIIPIPEPISFEVDINILKKDGSISKFSDVTKLFTKDVEKQIEQMKTEKQEKRNKEEKERRKQGKINNFGQSMML